MKKLILLCAALMVTWKLPAQSNAPVRLALIAESPEVSAAADVLTVELSKNPKLQLLERTEIERVYWEQALSAGNRDYLKLGQVLGADGLLLLQPSREGTNQFLSARLVAVKPGVVIGITRLSWPITDLAGWSRWIGNHFAPLLPKLSVPAKDAVPISVVNLRSAVRSREAEELERQLTVLVIERLTREPELFVLERRRMELLSGEKELSGTTETAFWNGSGLLDGIVDRDGYAKETMTLSVRLIPARGGTPVTIELSGSRTNLPAIVERLAEKMRETLKLTSRGTAWSSADEADRYFEEAKWAFRWHMLNEAQAACESSWALGKTTKEVAELRIRIYREECLFPQNDWLAMNPTFPEYAADSSKLDPAARALGLYQQDFQTFLVKEAMTDTNWYVLSLDVLLSTTEVLRRFYFHPEARVGHEEQLEELRRLSRETAGMVRDDRRYHAMSVVRLAFRTTFNGRPYLDERPPLAEVELVAGALWRETPEQCLEEYRKYARSDQFHQLRRCYSFQTITAWRTEDRDRIPEMWRQFVQELCDSTNGLIKVEGYYLALADARPDDYEEAVHRMFEVVLRNALLIEQAGLTYGLVEDIKKFGGGTLRGQPKFEVQLKVNELFRGFKADVDRAIESAKRAPAREALQAYLQTNSFFSRTQFDGLSSRFYARLPIDEADARALLPLLNDYRNRLSQRRDETPAPFDTWRGFTNQMARLEFDLTKALAPRPVTGAARPFVFPGAFTNIVQGVPLDVSRFWSIPHLKSDLTPMPAWSRATAISDGCFREGRLWLEVRYSRSGTKGIIFGVDLENPGNAAIEIPLEQSDIASPGSYSGLAGHHFEILGGSLYLCSAERLRRYSLRSRTWEELAAPVAGPARLTLLGRRLFATTADSILEITDGGRGAHVLASSRRRPAVNSLDALDAYDRPPVLQGPNGSIRVLIRGKLYDFDEGRNDWTQTATMSELTVPLTSTMNEQGIVSREDNGSRIQWFLLRQGQSIPELAFAADRPGIVGGARPPFRKQNSDSRSVLKPQWNFPANMLPMSSYPCLDGDRLWVVDGSFRIESSPEGQVTFRPFGGAYLNLVGFEQNQQQGHGFRLKLAFESKLLSPEFVDTFRPAQQGTRIFDAQGPVLLSTPPGLVLIIREIPHVWWITRAEILAGLENPRSQPAPGPPVNPVPAQQP